MRQSSTTGRNAEVTIAPARISIILPVKNDSARAIRAIASIRRFALPETEIVLVDNESDTEELARQTSSLVDVYLRQGGKPGDCRQAGVAASSGEILFFMDADQELRLGTLAAAVARLHGCDAVVVPERPRDESRFLHRLIRAERVWTEWLGFGLPRLFSRRTYWAIGGHAIDVTFGEDRFLDSKDLHLGVSDVPIVHDEIPSFGRLLKKYRAYGRASARQPGGLKNIVPWKVRRPTGRGRRPSPKDMLLFPVVIGLKLAKLAALVRGSLEAHREERRAHSPAAKERDSEAGG